MVARGSVGLIWRLARFMVPVYLVGDYLYTDSDMMQRRRIREKLQHACSPPPPLSSPRLPTAGPSIANLLSGGPVAIAGPAGSGKSQFMEDTAAALAASPAKGSAAGDPTATAKRLLHLLDGDSAGSARPVVHLRLCKAAGPVTGALPSASKDGVAQLQADLIADAVLSQLGVPVLPSALRLLWARTVCFLSGQMPSQWAEARLSRVDDALRILYEEADALSRERRRKAGIPAECVTPVIMVDNADSFVDGSALANLGGSRVFSRLLVLAHFYVRDVKTILAGSPALHMRPELTAASREDSQPAARIFQLGDPDVPSALTALQTAGHSRETAETIVAALGTRVGLLRPHLDPAQPHDAATARKELDKQLKDVQVQLQRAITSIDCRYTRGAAARICKDAAGTPSAMLLPGQLVQPIAWRPSSNASSSTEDAANVLLAAGVVYQREDNRLAFASEPLLTAWQRVKKECPMTADALKYA